MAVIYVDVLFVLNLIIDYLLLSTTAKMLKKDVSKLMLISGAIIGSFYTILILCVDYSIFSNTIINMVFSTSLIRLTYGKMNYKSLFRATVMFYFVNFAFCGGIYAVASMLGAGNSYVTFGIFTFYSVVAYILLTIGAKYRQKTLEKKKIKLVIGIGKKEKTIDCIVDTGNSLYTPYTGKPVIIAEKSTIYDILPNDFPGNNELKPIIIPFNSVGCNNGIIYGFKPDYAYFVNNGNRVKAKRAIVGVYDGVLSVEGNYNGLVNPSLVV